jgi:hypothetical protein
MQSPVRVAGLKQERANITVAASKCEFSLRMTRARARVYANTCVCTRTRVRVCMQQAVNRTSVK